MKWIALGAALLLATTACETESPDCGEPLYGGDATDEAWRTMVDVKGLPTDSSRAVTLIAPSEGTRYPADAAPPVLEWSSPLRASLLRPERGIPSLEATPRRERAWASWLGELLIPSAHAHLPPYTGDLYWVEISAPGSACPVAQFLTSELVWRVDPLTWNELSSHAGKTLSLQVTSAYLAQNRVTEGPYRLATPLTFVREAP